MKSLIALLVLNGISGLGPKKIRALLQVCGGPESVFQSSPDHLAQAPGVGPQLIDKILSAKNEDFWKRDWDLVQSEGVSLLPFWDPLYPAALKARPDAPILLYCKGKLHEADDQSLAIVGTRSPSIYGKEAAFQISRDLANGGYTIVSGLARGVDTAAHQGALESGRTIAVIGSGLSRLYPAENRNLASAICENGAVLSEYPMVTPPDRKHFPQRNRIVSAMSQGVLLVEAPQKSGAMITMEKAKIYKKYLFALPGRIDWPTFAGNHQLIKSGSAQLIEGAQDIAAALQPLRPKAQPQVKPIKLNPDEESLIKQLGKVEHSFDEIAQFSELPVAKLNVLLMGLVLKRTIKEYPGKIYRVVSPC